MQSKRFNFFLGLGVLLSLINVFIMNDVATVWSGAEAQLIRSGVDGSLPYFLPAIVQSALTGDLTFQAFLSRLPGAVLLLLSALVYYILARPIFGKVTTALTLLTWSATLVLANIGKIATADSWLFFSQLLAWVATLRYLKQPREQWRILTFAALLLALWLHPFSTIVVFSLSSWWLYRFHPNGYRLQQVNPWIVLAAGGIALFILGQWEWQRPAYVMAFFSMPYHHFLLILLLAILPVLGFFLGGLRDTFQKLRKKEELAIITSAWLIGGLAGQSLLVFAAAGLIIAKQLMLYFEPHYPHRSLVRAGAVLHLAGAFFGITVLMIFSFGEFGALGFRSALALGALYWMLSFISVIGLYGPNRRLVWGGSLLSGILFSLIFWLQYYPLLETRRNWPQRLEVSTQQMGITTQSNLYVHQLPLQEREKAHLYLEPLFKKVIFTDDPEQLLEFYRNAPGNAFFVPAAATEELGTISDSVRVQGWSDRLKALDYLLIRN